MIKLLVVVNDSASSLWAVRHAAFLYREGSVSEIVLLNVQRPIEYGRASAYHSLAELRERERRAGEAVLAGACEILADSGVKYVAQIGIGTPVKTILDAAQACRCDGIVLGVSAWSRLLALAGAGIPASIMRRSRVPVTLVNAPMGAQVPVELRMLRPGVGRPHPALVVYPAGVQPDLLIANPMRRS
ncbi:universal stress protein [Cupriavidus sp. AcVe19-6a]|uniref:universal stress protein n=1 Tax=Cupriavidus sp. AcVe19-6a TaxID=2821358 RepID=UPI001AE513C2|nr:universal stress protein [Cupriavidus sp. AcVe19-6a]MBP0639320.1 universal stress protein [Cupriavidus sp. AcVe19-6a]